ncbi:imidazolonepropionase [Sphingomonas astaxanthinifaciens]|uniref:Imidazolonepropionase n=1 Tax=Sphingomonas astaxanthinifaciens DSM 22298 TaxID=1123267 RepID=A0ABQ5Z488_9SPHN|nr:imidazolonepropionase [Sphingomonas astaxanthinifaciens]GLR47558.1 imidazolonepropionase [Sphingomonas astaxanthinifaciens DSM 22298]
MWDRLITDCHVLTMEPIGDDPLGLIRNAAIGIHEGRVVRVGRRTDLAGTRAAEVVPLGGAFVTPGLVDCHTHLVFGGTRATEHAMRRAGASYEDIASAGGGIASTVAATAAASVTELLEQSRARLHALMRGGVTTVEIKSGYGIDPASELRLLNVIRTLARSEPVRVAPTLLALHALPKGADRAAYVERMVEDLLPTVARLGLATSVDAFCEGIAFTPQETERLFEAASAHGLPVRLHAEQLSNSHGAALAARHRALSADHLEHLDEAGAAAMAASGTVAVLLPGAFYTLGETKRPPVDLLRKHGVPIAVASDCNPGTSPSLVPQLAMNMACNLFDLTPEEAIAGMTVNAAAALGLAHEVGTIAPGKAADLAVWRIAQPAELGYWMGLQPERRIFGGQDSPTP